MEPSVWSWDQYFEFSKPELFSQRIEIQFKQLLKKKW
jgi:hypothetical protein